VRAERRSVSQPAQPKGRKRWGLRFSLGFGLATAVLAFATFELAKQDLARGRQLKQLQAKVAQSEAAMQAMGQVAGAPDSAQIILLQQPGGPPGQARVVYNARMGMGVYSGLLAPAPAGKSYQLWLVPASGSPVNAGLVATSRMARWLCTSRRGWLPRPSPLRWNHKAACPSLRVPRSWSASQVDTRSSFQTAIAPARR